MKNKIEWINPEPGVEMAALRELEATLDVSFPKDYIECALENHGGRPSLDCLDFGGEEERLFGALLPITGGESRTILEEVEDSQGYIPDRVVPFACDPFGNLFCFDYRQSETPQVVFWNHEEAHAGPEACITKVARSFTELLEMLYQ